MSTITDGITTLAPMLVLGYQTVQAGRSVFHDIIGRPAPDVSLSPLALRSGTISYLWPDEAAAEACRQLHQAGGPIIYTADDNPATGMRYVVDSSGVTTTLDDEGRRRWTVDVAYREVAS